MNRRLRLETRIVRQSVVSGVSFFVNLGLLYIFYTLVGIPYLLAIPLTFLVTTTANYVATRKLIFPETDQKMIKGFAFFATLTAVYVGCITLGVVFLVELFGVNVYVARILSGFIFSAIGFFVNGRYNFHVL